MEVILLERVGRLGGMGDVVKVRAGFARNYLIPQKKALRANEENKKEFEARKDAIAADNAKLKAAAEKLAKTFEGVKLTLVRQASEDGKLYGSVTSRDVAEALAEAGHKVERRLIDVGATIKNTGVYTAKVALHPEVIVNVQVTIGRNETEAEAAAQKVDESVIAPIDESSDDAPQAAAAE